MNSTDPITLGGHVLTTSDQTFADGLTARYEHNASTGEGTIYYSYTLPAATSGDDTSAQFALVVSDADGDAAPASNLVINIVDDQPVARVDSGDVTEGATLNMDASSGVLSNDTAGADGWANSGNAVVGVVAGTSTAAENANVGQAIAGTYGTLTLRADGSYTYESTANAVTSDAQDVFTYTVKDSDGDLVETTLTINVADVTATPTNTSGQVDEAGLANGTDSSSTSEQITGGSLNLQTNWNVNGEQSGNTGLGTWTVKADGTFDYTLTSNTKDEAGRPETDSFTYTAKDQYGNTVTNTVTITIVDDAPLVALSGTSPGSVTVDESNFAAGSVSATHADFVSDVFDINHGADSAAATDGTVYSLSVTNGTASGVTDTATSTNIYLFMDGTDVVGRVGNNASGTEAFRIEINSNTGAVTLTQNRPLKHPDINNHDDALSVTDGAIKLEATVKDGDGDTAKASVNIGGKFNFKDDGPSVDGQPAKSIVDEKYLASGSEAGEGVTSVTAALPVDAGKDGMGSLVFSADQDDLLNTLKLTGNTGITLTVNDNVLTATRDGAKVFTVTLDKDTGKYKFELKGALTHPSAVSGNFDLSFNYEIKDADGDTAPGKFVVNVVDDAPKSDISITTPEDTPFGPFTTSADSTKDNVSIQDADGNNAASAATLPDGVTDIPAGTAGYNVGHGIVVVDANGQVTYHPNTDYSNNGSEDGFKVTVSNDDGSNTVTNVTVNVTPVSDAPNIPHANDGASDVDAITVTTQEGTSVPLGLKTPVITDKTDKNGSGKTGDDPERLGAITLTPDASAPNGTLLTKGDDTPLTANPDGSYTIVIVETSGETDVDTGLHLSGGLPTENVNYLTRTEYEAIQAKPADDRHENFDVVVSVDSYEVDGSGNKLPDAEVDGTNGSNSQQTITVDVLAVTDAPAIALTAPADPTTVGATSLNVADASGTDNAKITAAMEEDGTLDLQSVLGETLKDADGSESYWYDISGLPEGTVVTINGKAYTAGADGKIEMPEADYLSADDGGNPTFSIKPPQDYSNSTADNMTITLYTKDSDSDSTVTTTAESASVDLELRVYAKPDDVKLQNPEATPEDTAVGLLNSLALKDTDGSESITQVRITDLPSEGGSWTLIDHNGNEVAIPSGGDATSGGLILTVGTGAGEYTLEQIQQFTIKPPAHSSLDGTMTVYVTTEEAAAYTQSGNTESKEWAHDQAIVVTPVAEVTTPPAGGDTDSDGNTTPDLTMTSGYNYSNSGLEDTWFSLNSDGFNLKTDWANEDASEQTFARLTPYDGKDVALEGAYFQYHNGTTTVDVAYNGTPVDIPMEYLDTVRFKGPNNFKGEVKIKVEAVTLDKDADDNSVTVEAVSGEALLTNVILDPVADQVTLKVNARITASEDTPNIPLTINPTSGDPDETFNITIKGIPAGASITYKGVTYSVGNGLVDDGNGRYQLELSNFDKAQQPTLTPPKDSNETINLTVSAVSVDTLGDTTSTSAAHELPVTITLIGVPDTPNMVVAESPSYVEQTLDNADNTVALHELITSLSSGETSNDGSETLTLRISGLPEGFALLGAGAVVGAGTGSARVWVVKPDQIADGTVKIQLPANYSGTVNFTAQPVVTENDNPSETFFDAQNVEFQVTPSPEASLKVASSIAEDQVGRIDLSPVYQNGDNDEVISVVRIQAVEGLALFSDAAGTKPLTAVDGWYEITGVDAVKSIYAKASANFSGDIPLTVKYKVTDTAQDNTTGPVETADFKDGSHTLQVQPVTDAVLAEVASINGSNVNDQTAISHTATQPGDVTVSLNISKQPDSNANDERDYDGSEAITHILIQNVPEGVAVKGGIYTGDGQWLLPVTTAFNGDITQDVVFSVGRQAGGLTNSAITITVATQDGTASPEKDSISWQLTTDFTKGSNEQTLPTISLSEVVDSQTEDDDFALNKVVSAAVDTTGANQSNYSMTLTLRTSPDDETSFSGNGMLRTEVVENGQTVVL
ncbi:DUF5801 repeats-in-toxin domain-containing protein [Halomonas sp. PAR7]|uniref:DUF5801 repeats-in-toxin domain-containing protein n=1 Tax=Halomonas sp. PAR7 TaxID=3075514 RepID=UPI0028879A24|nr:DUF5801 repeats-in-toxin domain-containing protein [Halomonas sp. PAR7]MDT0501903.1 DUF5801 repeats-in-toxin domain-containing protein [Halomonas sp. PAR7]